MNSRKDFILICGGAGIGMHSEIIRRLEEISNVGFIGVDQGKSLDESIMKISSALEMEQAIYVSLTGKSSAEITEVIIDYADSIGVGDPATILRNLNNILSSRKDYKEEMKGRVPDLIDACDDYFVHTMKSSHTKVEQFASRNPGAKIGGKKHKKNPFKPWRK